MKDDMDVERVENASIDQMRWKITNEFIAARNHMHAVDVQKPSDKKVIVINISNHVIKMPTNP